MSLNWLPKSSLELARSVWLGLQRVDPLNMKLMGLLALLLFFTDVIYETQRSPEHGLSLIAFSLISIVVFFLVYLGLVLPARKIASSAIRGIVQIILIVLAEITKSAAFIWLLHPAEFQVRYLDRLPGDITIAALYWMVAGVILTSFDEHRLAINELNRASEKLEEQRNIRLNTAIEVEDGLQEKANRALAGELDRLSKLSESVFDSAETSQLKLQIQSLIRNQVRPLSRELRSRVKILQMQKPKPSSVTRFTQIRSLSFVPAVDTSLVASYVVTIPNIFFTVVSKTTLANSFLVLAVSLTYPIIGRLIQFLLPRRKISVFKGLLLPALLSLISYIPTGIAVSLMAPQYPLLEVTVFTAGGVLMFTAVLGSAWFLLKRERAEKVDSILELNKQIKHELDLLDQAIWVAQRKWSYLIHGTVQASLTVAASRLEMSNGPDEKLRLAVQSDIERAKRTLTAPPDLKADVKELFEEISETWRGVCDFEWQIARSAIGALGRSGTSTTCFVEIAKELISNASRHGGATKFWLNAYLNQDGDLEVVAGNNGKALAGNYSSGLGFQMIAELTKNWNFERDKATGFSAVLPMPRV